MVAGTETTEDRLRGQLEELRGSYDEAVVAPRTLRRGETTALLVFEVGSATFAVRAEHLVEVVRAEGMVAVPCSPPQIAGALTHRQETVSVLDLRRLLEIPDRTDAEPGWVLVLRPRSEQRALLVGSVIGLRRLHPDELDIASSGEEGASCIAGSLVVDGRSVALLNVEALSSVTSS